MPHFETSRVYTVVPETGRVGVRHNGDVQPVDLDQSAYKFRSLFRATGLHRMDFAVFGASLSDDGASEHGLLVLSHQHGQGLLVDADYLADNPRHLTAELAKKIATVSREELEDFTIEPVLSAIATRFPNARGFTK